jgi:L-ascorbate metabolism protein UlaG (beta-lactamase superfamily)
MELTYLGAGCVRLATKTATFLIDPFEKAQAAAKADVALLTEEKPTEFEGMKFDGPGEYEVQGVMITGVPARLHIDESGERGTIYGIRSEGVNVVVTGNIAAGISDQQNEALGKVDVLVLPVGGHGLTLDATAAAELVSRLEPAYVVPVHYNDGKTTYEMPQDEVDVFLKEIGANPEPITKLKVNAKDLPVETQPVYLTRG